VRFGRKQSGCALVSSSLSDTMRSPGSSLWLAVAILVAVAAPAAAASLSGRVIDEHGAPIEGAAVLAVSLRFQPCCGPEYTFLADGAGNFGGEVDAGEYVLHASGPTPLAGDTKRVVVPAFGLNGVELRLLPGPFVFTADRPPVATRIAISTPTAEGAATVTGAAGAVGPGDFVLVTTLDSGDFGWTTAAADGSFSLAHRAPPGSWVFVRNDPLGVGTQRMLLEIATGGGEGGAASVPGAMVRVGDGAPPGTGRAVAGIAGPCKRGLPSFAFQGRIAPAATNPGGTLTLEGTLRAHAPGIASSTLEVNAFLYLTPAAYANGSQATSRPFMASHLLTPTGLPIERAERLAEGIGAGLGNRTLHQTSPGEYAEAIAVTLSVPPDLPPGFYHPVLNLLSTGSPCLVGPGPGVPVALVDHLNRRGPGLFLPPVRIGTPQPPHLFWALLSDTLSNGSPGAVAVEDQGRFALAPRTLTQSTTFAVPRRHAPSGQPLSYRLEPFLPLVSIGDRGDPADSPRIPFRFPSGELRLTVRAPDGSEVHAGPAPFVQTRVRTPVDTRGDVLGLGGGSMGNVLQLSTMDPAFDVVFTQEGLHEVRLEGWIEDVAGQRWSGGGTYRLWVADPLTLDTTTLPGTPLEVGDSLHLGMQVLPPVPADVEVVVRFSPGSNPQAVREVRRRGRANRFGYLATVDGFFTATEAGEYRVDVTASYHDPGGAVRAGGRTWGGVVAPRDARLIAHGRRCTDGCPLGPQWFDRGQIGFAFDHLFFPFHRGDVAWQVEERDAVKLAITVQDPAGSIANLLQARVPGNDVEARAAAGELPLVSSRPGDQEPNTDPSRVDLWAYSYRSVQRPLVRVREIVGEDNLPSEYWRFNDQYNDQPGMGEKGDLPNDFKLLFGGAVLRGAALPQNEYAAYGALWVHLPSGEPIERSRVFPPFQGNGGGPSGGPLMTLKGRAIDLFWHPTAVRPGSVLEIGDRVSFAGYLAPTLPGKLALTVTAPSGAVRTLDRRANKVGYVYDPSFDFYADEPGEWTVTVRGSFDGVTSAGQVTAPFPTGDVLGTADGKFSFYVVRRDAPALVVDKPAASFVRPAAGTVPFAFTNPPGVSQTSLRQTTTMPGFVLEQRSVTGFSHSYDAALLAQDFPNLDLFDAGGRAGADAVTMSFLAAGKDGTGADAFRARQLLLQGEELFAPPQQPQWPCVPDDMTLCLNQGRFAVTGTWRTDSAAGVAHAVGLTADSGYFWFFGRDNVEVLVKALDACGVNQQFWIFAAGLTDVEVELRVRDTLTGSVQGYTNAAGTPFAPLQDTAAFPTCGAPPAPGAVPAFVPPITTGGSSATCTPTPTALCLAAGRFRVEASWRTGAGTSGQALASPLTADTGTFAFFDPNNVEAVVKVLDACSLPGAPRFWVFAAGLTNVEVVLTVTDTKTSTVNTYTNPLHRAFQPVQDTAAFPTCP
jgi:hypothetical protein